MNITQLNNQSIFQRPIMRKTTSHKPKLTSRKAVAPVIATLLLVAIAVVGGGIVFVFAQDFFDIVPTVPLTIESVQVLGYDARDATTLQIHDGTSTAADTAGTIDGTLLATERVAIYVQNSAAQPMIIDELRFAGTVYAFESNVGTLDTFALGAAPGRAEYAILTDSPSTLLNAPLALLQPGEQATLILTLDDTIKIGRDAQFKLTTTDGAVFLGSVKIGQQRG